MQRVWPFHQSVTACFVTVVQERRAVRVLPPRVDRLLSQIVRARPLMGMRSVALTHVFVLAPHQR